MSITIINVTKLVHSLASTHSFSLINTCMYLYKQAPSIFLAHNTRMYAHSRSL